MISVFVTKTGEPEEQRTFAKSMVMIGRAEGNDIVLPDARGVSRYHLRADVEDGLVVLTDLNSTNGTYVNADQISRTPVTPEDLVSVGDTTLRFVFEEDGSQEQYMFRPAEEEEKKEQEPHTEEFEPKVEEIPAPEAGVQERDFYWSSLKNFLAPVWDFIVDESVTEVLINSPTEIYIERKGQLERVDASFSGPELKAAVLNIAQYVGRRIDEQEPYLDARLPDGSRVAVLLPPCARKGISVSIRKFSKEALTLDNLLSFGSLSQEMLTFLRACIFLRKNVIISGGTSSGKTSLLNVLSSLIPADERILTIEDSAELQLKQEHVVPMETRPPDKKGRGQVTIRDLVRASLRMRPDRIIVGEIRGGEALDLLQAMNTGHSGSMATVHASSPPQALTRLETLALFSGLEIPMRALREQVSSAIDIIVQAARLPDRTRKVTHISELRRADDEQYHVCDIFRFNRTSSSGGKIQGSHVQTGEKPVCLAEMELAGLTDAVALFR